MNRDQIGKHFELWTEQMKQVMLVKNKDYGINKDPFANLRAVEMAGISMDHGIIIRMLDKMSRLCSFYEKGHFAVKDETMDDTLIDLCNYAFLHWVVRTEKENGCKNENSKNKSDSYNQASDY